MNKKNILLFLFAICLAFLPGCKDEEIQNGVFSIESSELQQEFDKAAASVTIPVNTNLSVSDWEVEPTASWIFTKKNSGQAGQSIELSVSANTGTEKRTGIVRVTSPVQNYVISVTQYSTSEVIVDQDIKVTVIGGTASENQPGQGIENTWDGKFASDGAAPYHSVWGQSAKFPVTLEYYFKEGTEIDYLIYYTRSGNGNFGEVDIYLAADAQHQDYKLYGSYNFRMQNAPSKVTFKETQKVTAVKFEVKSGAGNFVSCDEMEFYKYNSDKTMEKRLLTVFTDITCSELKEGVTEEQINALPDYFIRVANALLNNSYDEYEKEFRIRQYEAYSNVEEWAEKLMTKKYGNLDNPTGISVQKGEEIIVLVGDTHGQQVSLQSIWESDGEYKQTNVSGDVYLLSPGINKLTMREQGQLFVMYNTDITSPDARPIKIHIPLGSGKVTGFFDLKEHKTDQKYAELLKKASHKYFCVRGERIMFYFHTSKMLEYVPDGILSAINLWDDIIGWQQELMGIEDVRPSQVNNHIFAISPEGSYMWATDYNIGFVYTYLNNILLKENVMAAKDNAWGPAHEIGHVHQLAIDWPGCTESSNNLFANYVIYKLGKYGSRGDVLSSLAKNRFVKKQPWVTLGEATHQNEDTEIHMRMYWQLWNYYHRLNHNPRFWQTLFKLMRAANANYSDPGAKQMIFAEKACEAAGEDLSEFFEMWGFFEPVDIQISQYGNYQYTVTQEMIEQTKARMKAYGKKPQPFYYLEDRKKDDFDIGGYQVGDVGHWEQFKANKPITKKPTYSLSGQKVSVKNGDEAVAFELRSSGANGKLLYFSTSFDFDIPAEIPVSGNKLYAVQPDGKRIEITKQ